MMEEVSFTYSICAINIMGLPSKLALTTLYSLSSVGFFGI